MLCVLISVDELSEDTMLPEGLDALLPRSEADESMPRPVGIRLAEEASTLGRGAEDFVAGGVRSEGVSLLRKGTGNDSDGRGSRFFFS